MRFYHHSRNLYHRIVAGPFTTIVAAAVAGSMLTCGALALAVVLPRFAFVVFPVGIGFGILLLTFVILLLTRLIGKLNDVRYLLSFEGGLRRSGYPVSDFFSEGAFANPSLHLFLLKCLQLAAPQSILELGSGQTTKVLAAYHHANPATHVVTLEQDEAWAKLFLPQVTIDGVRHDYRLCPLETRAFIVPVTSRTIRTQWYGGAQDLAARSFGLILVDGPNHGGKGTDFTPYSRAGILEYLPAILDEPWIVIFDDAERYGEVMTITEFQAMLRRSRRPFLRFELYGEKIQSVFCSPALNFLRSI